MNQNHSKIFIRTESRVDTNLTKQEKRITEELNMIRSPFFAILNFTSALHTIMMPFFAILELVRLQNQQDGANKNHYTHQNCLDRYVAECLKPFGIPK